MTYLEFLLQWYNWPYLVALVIAGAARLFRARLRPLGSVLQRLLSLERVAPHTILSVYAILLAVVGLTITGAIHDYWPGALPGAFAPALLVSGVLAAIVTHGMGRVLERYFPEIRAVGFGARDLAGHEGRVVSRSVGPEYRAGRAQVMTEDGTLHMVLCKTRERKIPYGARVVLKEYDPEDGRYYVERTGAAAVSAGGGSKSGEPDEAEESGRA